jgi:hypothetical protein
MPPLKLNSNLILQLFKLQFCFTLGATLRAKLPTPPDFLSFESVVHSRAKK